MPMINTQSEISPQDLKRLRSVWAGMKTRCYNPKDPYFHLYGGKGVSICPRWVAPKTGFLNFVADMGPKPTSAHSLDRKDSAKNYEPTNCRWAKKITQSLNSANRSPHGYGVKAHKNGRFYVQVKGKGYGGFATAEEARVRYHEVACQIYGADYRPD